MFYFCLFIYPGDVYLDGKLLHSSAADTNNVMCTESIFQTTDLVTLVEKILDMICKRKGSRTIFQSWLSENGLPWNC